MSNATKHIEALRDLLDHYFRHNERLRILNAESIQKQLQDFARKQDIEIVVPEEKQIYPILWDMVMERIIQPAIEKIVYGPGIAAFCRTEYGENFLQGLPIDRPNQYLDYLESEVSNIDQQILVYVRESLDCYNLGCYFASSVMLGVATETLFDLLLDAYTTSISTPNAQTQFKKSTEGKAISKQYDEFNKKLPDLTGTNGIEAVDSTATRYLREDFKHAIEITLKCILSYRNYAAHPRSNGVVPRHIIMGHLNAFPLFCSHIYQAIDYLKQNPAGNP
jgi:hypothetical protein